MICMFGIFLASITIYQVNASQVNFAIIASRQASSNFLNVNLGEVMLQCCYRPVAWMPSKRYPRTFTLTTHLLPTPKGWVAELASGYSKQFQWLEWNLGPHTFQPYALTIWPHCNIYPFTQGHCKLCLHKMIKSQKSILGVPKNSCIWSTKDEKPLVQFLKHFVLNKQGTLNPIWTGLFASLRRLGAKCFPPS